MLNNYNFKSIFKDELNYFVKYKRSSGLKYENEIYRLKYIDNILYSLNLKTKKITKETFFKLIERNNMVGENYARQYSVTKDFCKFLISNKYKDIYYKDKKFKFINNYKPIIFSDNEINLLFQTMDEYKNKYKGRKYYKLYYSYSILFRLLYACGLRLSEVIKITINAINFNENTINIINAKRPISRLEKGYDENIVIVYLYKYMGHKYIAETEYYLHFTNYNKNKIVETNDTFSKGLYKGVDLDD